MKTPSFSWWESFICLLATFRPRDQWSLVMVCKMCSRVSRRALNPFFSCVNLILWPKGFVCGTSNLPKFAWNFPFSHQNFLRSILGNSSANLDGCSPHYSPGADSTGNLLSEDHFFTLKWFTNSVFGHVGSKRLLTNTARWAVPLQTHLQPGCWEPERSWNVLTCILNLPRWDLTFLCKKYLCFTQRPCWCHEYSVAKRIKGSLHSDWGRSVVSLVTLLSDNHLGFLPGRGEERERHWKDEMGFC